MSLRTLSIGYTLATLIAAAPALTREQPAGAAPWYRRSRTLDITGTNPSDSVVLTATGPRPDKLSIEAAFFVGGTAVHRQRWTSEDELYEADSLRRSPARLAAFMRTRLDTVLTLVKRERINREQVQHMGDAAMLRRITPRPTHQVVLSFAFETSVFLAWDPTRRRMVVFMECC